MRRPRVLSPLERKLQEARATKEQIGFIDLPEFLRAGSVVHLPFPGLRCNWSGERPPLEFSFLGGRLDHRLILTKLFEGDSRGIVIVGAKGSGKSSILRAIGVELIQRLSAAHKVVCIWYFDVRQDLARQVKDALLFAYSDYDADSEVIEEIEEIKSVEHLRSFMQTRKAEGDVFTFLSDGEEKADVRRGEETKRRIAAREWLSYLEQGADNIIKALSPAANDARELPNRFERYRMQSDLFTEDEHAIFLEESLLGRMLSNHPEREEVVNTYSGRHPMSLFSLNKACEDYVRNLMPWSRKRRRYGIGVLDEDYFEGEGDVELSAEYLDDDDDWKAVLDRFKKLDHFGAIRSFIGTYQGDLTRLRSPASLQTGYVMENGYFCTDYLYQVHSEAALKRLRSVFRSPTFVAYLNDKLSKPHVVWPEVGWAVEGFVGDVIMSLGLKFSGRVLLPAEIEMLEGEPRKLQPEHWHVAVIRYLMPGTYSFKYADGLLVWVDKDSVVHIVVLQVTLSPETHWGTEKKFMQQAHVSRWYTGNCILHYVYICPVPPSTAGEKKNNKKMAGRKKADTKKKVEGADEPMVDYTPHHLRLSECFPDLPSEERQILEDLARLRVKEVERRLLRKQQQHVAYDARLRSLPPKKWKFLKEAEKMSKLQGVKTRDWLEEVALQHGVEDPSSRDKYRNICMLLEAMQIKELNDN